MRLTPPTNITFIASIVLGLAAVAAGMVYGFATSSYIALAGLVALAAGNLFERL
ncbi:hypothetical protein HY497_01915 [Candidatus Woesearchaeota archaeon]|nr:hypothetical protein [Candidatus Woesearchaeota archaeon]